MSLQCKFRPIAAWPRPLSKTRRNGQFTAGYTDTLTKLETEIGNLRGKNVVVQTAMRPDDIRQDGWPRANARRPVHPGVIVSFDSVHGPLQFCCDAFYDWEDNLRGIALTLERLRLADLYGVTRHGEQYKGWAALPAPAAESSSTSGNTATPPEGEAGRTYYSPAERDAMLVADLSGLPWRNILLDAKTFQAAYRQAAVKVHPDNGGSHERMAALNGAADRLKARHGL